MARSNWKNGIFTAEQLQLKNNPGALLFNSMFGKRNAPPADPAAVAPTAPAAPPAPPAPTPSPAAAPGNPALTIPGVDIRLTGENLGIKPKSSTARRTGQVGKGTSRLTIPRSSGANSLNFG